MDEKPYKMQTCPLCGFAIGSLNNFSVVFCGLYKFRNVSAISSAILKIFPNNHIKLKSSCTSCDKGIKVKFNKKFHSQWRNQHGKVKREKMTPLL